MNKEIPQLATIKINCNSEIGTAVLFFPGEDLEEVYILTAKHCLTGKKFDKSYTYKDITLKQLFNPITQTYHTCNLTETDVIVVSENTEDLALIIMPKQRIIEFIGNEFRCQVINTNPCITEYIVRGFANLNSQLADRQFPMTFVEDQKDNNNLFIMKSDENLDTYLYRALENVEGLSGSGAFAILNGTIYLTSIVHGYEDGNIFTATKVIAYNRLIDSAKFQLIEAIEPEINPEVLESFKKIEDNRERINQRTNNTVGTVNIPRETHEIIQLLESSSMAVIHGKPGVGKSALAKSLTSTLKDQSETTVITFTAEQLYCTTLKDALLNAGYTANLSKIVSSPLSGPRVIIWIESFEKLIESGFDDAIKELLSFVNSFKHVQLLVTIRDYTLQKFKINYRFELPNGNIYHELKDFSDQEMDMLGKAIPEILPLLGNTRIKRFLRTPYYLDKAVRIIPELLKVDQLDEFTFKRLMWEYIVEAGNEERGKIFSAICLKRASEMSLFTSSTEPIKLIMELVSDNILQKEESDLGNRYSPSHDILEDWVLVRYIKQRFNESENALSFIISLNNSPAFLRGFRLWLDEFYKNEPASSADFVQTIILNTAIDQKIKNILLIGTLRSDHPEILFDTMTPYLLADNGMNLREIITLLKTGCQIIDHENRDLNHFLPVGSGWDYIIQFIRRNLQKILLFETFEFTYLSLIESWSKQLPEFNVKVLPPSSQDAAYLLLDFIHRHQDTISGYRRGRHDQSMLKKHISILFKLTSSAPEIVKELIEASVNVTQDHPRWTNKQVLESIRNYVTEGVMSDQICKYYPEQVLAIANEEWKQKEKIRRSGSLMSMIREEPKNDDFGLDERIKNDYGFPSGYQTFFYWMFLYHAKIALDFLIPFLNVAFSINQQARKHRGTELKIINVAFNDGSSKQYFGCFEYWVMYRGANSNNRLIASLLMALEKSLLELSDKSKMNYPSIRKYLEKMIKDSNNVAVLAVVSSLIQAHPTLLDETSISLLGIREFFRWDGTRCSNEMMSHSEIYNDDPFQKQERIIENKRKHRLKYYQGLVGFVSHYMFYEQTYNELLFNQVDYMWKNKPKKDDIWRKFLFDMDARKYCFQPIEKPGFENMRQLVPGYDVKVKKLMSNSVADYGMPHIGTVWASNIFNHREEANNSYRTWKIGYKYILKNEGKFHYMTSPGIMATIGLRDFLPDLLPEENEWCQQELLNYGSEALKPKDYMSFSFVTDQKEAIMGLSLIFKTNPAAQVISTTKEIIFRLLISKAEEQEKIYLTHGMSNYLVETQPDFLRDCWFGLLIYISNIVTEGKFVGDSFDQDSENSEASDFKWMEDLVISVVSDSVKPPVRVNAMLEMTSHWNVNDALRIIPYNTTLQLQHDFIQSLLKCHIEFLNAPTERHRYDYDDSRRCFTFVYARFLLAQPQEVAKNYFIDLLRLTLPKEEFYTDEFSKFIYGVVQEHIRAVNDGSSVTNFWVLWTLLKDWIEENKNGFLMPLLFLEIDWNDSTKKWHVMEGKNLFYKEFILNYGFNQINKTLNFLTIIGFYDFMPDSVFWVSEMLTSKNAFSIDNKLGDRFIQKAFYNFGTEIKNSKQLLNNFLFILDFLIKKGSTRAYMLKEELIQYKN